MFHITGWRQLNINKEYKCGKYDGMAFNLRMHRLVISWFVSSVTKLHLEYIFSAFYTLYSCPVVRMRAIKDLKYEKCNVDDKYFRTSAIR